MLFIIIMHIYTIFCSCVVQILKPAFTIIADHKARCFLLLIRGTHSIKDTLTAATGAVVPFHHTVVYEGGVSNVVLGYAHCGMVAAARWIAKLSIPCLTEALARYPGYKVKVNIYSLHPCNGRLLLTILQEFQPKTHREIDRLMLQKLSVY